MKVLYCVAIFALATAGPNFHWNWRDSQELHWKQTIRASKLRPERRDDLVKALLRLKTKDVPDTRIKEFDLNADGDPEVIAQGIDQDACSPTGNCPLWVFPWSGNHYRLLLNEQAQTFTIQPSKTNGFHDLVLGFHGSATNTGLSEYKFQGNVYRPAGCYEANWSYLDENGDVHDLKEPRITPCNK